MKALIASILILSTCLTIKAQKTIINVTKAADNKLLFNGSATLSAIRVLPVQFVFSNTFNHQKVSIYSTGTLTQDNLLTQIDFDETGANVFTLREDNIIDPVINQPVKIQTGKLYFKIGDKDSAGPFLINPYNIGYQPGYIFYDALKLAELKTAVQTDSIKIFEKAILRNYDIKTFSALQENTFLKDIFNGLFENTGGVQGTDGNGPHDVSLSSASSIGGLSVTNFADGLAKFLVTRFKEELTTAFFQKFKEQVSNSKELQTLFPQAFKVLLAIDKDVYQFSTYLNTLREAFIKDMGNLYTDFKKFKDLPKYKPYFDENPELKTILLNGLYFINQYSAGIHPGKVLAGYDTADINIRGPMIQHNIRACVSLLQGLSESFKSVSGDHYWVGADSIKLLLGDATGRDIYFGLLHQAYGSISFAPSDVDTVRFDKLLTKAKLTDKAMESYRQLADIISQKAQEINEYLANLKEIKKSDIDYNDYYKLYNASLDMVENAITITDLPAINTFITGDIKDIITRWSDRFLFVARNTGELYVDIRTKNYSSAILNLTGVLDTVLVNYGSTDDLLADKNQTLQQILKYGTFAANVAAAKNSDEVKAAIDAVALPAGSYAIKQKSNFNVAVNGYMGYAFDFNGGMSSGIYAPVGIAFSKGIGAKKNGGAITFFASLLDVGAIASYRLKDDTTSSLKQNIRLESILSPSAQLLYAIPKWPIALCFGYRLTPKLFYSNDTDFKVVKPRNVFNASILVDIPLFTIFNKTE